MEVDFTPTRVATISFFLGRVRKKGAEAMPRIHLSPAKSWLAEACRRDLASPIVYRRSSLVNSAPFVQQVVRRNHCAKIIFRNLPRVNEAKQTVRGRLPLLASPRIFKDEILARLIGR